MRRRRLPWLLLGALLAVGLRWVDLHPILLPDRPREARAVQPSSPEGAPFALWVAPGRLAPSDASFGATDWGLAWSNLLDQEFGPHRIAVAPEDGVPEEGVRLVVVTRGAAEAADAARLASGLEAFAAGGGVVILEMPPPASPLAALAGLAASGPPEPSEAPLSPGPAAPAWLPPDLGALPAPTVAATASAADGAEVLLLRAGGAALVARPRGDGVVLGLAFDLGRLLAAWQQGRPTDDFAVPDRWTERTGVVPRQSVDLVADPRLLEAAIPFADLVERTVADAARRQAPLPGWWSLPDAAPAALVLTHDEERVGDLAVFLAEHEAESGVGATFLVVPDHMSPEAARRIAELGGEVALHWDRGYPEPWTRSVGVSLFRPFRRRVGLDEQVAAMRELAGPESVRLHRLHGLLWGKRWDGMFRQLEAAGVELDSSLGPTGSIPPGFPFGTALPYHPLDSNGLPFRLWEIPFSFQDDERMDRGDTARLLERAGGPGHGYVVPIFHASTMGYRPSVDVFDEWLDAVALAARPGHWSGTLGDLRAFLDARARGALNVTAMSARRLECTALSVAPGQAIHLPSETVAGPLRDLLVDGERVDRERLAFPDPARVVVPLPAGEHQLQATYGTGTR